VPISRSGQKVQLLLASHAGSITASPDGERDPFVYLRRTAPDGLGTQISCHLSVQQAA
jgi:hypothetical protein